MEESALIEMTDGYMYRIYPNGSMVKVGVKVDGVVRQLHEISKHDLRKYRKIRKAIVKKEVREVIEESKEQVRRICSTCGETCASGEPFCSLIVPGAQSDVSADKGCSKWYPPTPEQLKAEEERLNSYE